MIPTTPEIQQKLAARKASLAADRAAEKASTTRQVTVMVCSRCGVFDPHDQRTLYKEGGRYFHAGGCPEIKPAKKDTGPRVVTAPRKP